LKIAQEQKDECSEELIQYLRTDMRDGKEGRPSPLDETIEKFTEMVNDAAFKIPIACFYENRATRYSSVLSGISENTEHGIDADDHGIVCPSKLGYQYHISVNANVYTDGPTRLCLH
jgi:hypothetical protein